MKKIGNIKAIFRYTEEAMTTAQCRIEPQPWLHIAIKDEGWYVVYVWDTREIMAVGMNKNLMQFKGIKVVDNHQPLQGKYADIFDFGNTDKPAKQETGEQKEQRLFKADIQEAKAVKKFIKQNWNNYSAMAQQILNEQVLKYDVNNAEAKYFLKAWHKVEETING